MDRVTSDRQYGNTMNVPTSGVTPTTQRWVGALDDTVSAGTDRSHPPFWLPNRFSAPTAVESATSAPIGFSTRANPRSPISIPRRLRPLLPLIRQLQHGSVGYPGSAALSSGTFTVVAGGDDIWNQNDAFHYVYAPVTGDFQFRARVTSLGYADYWSKAGVMLRDTLASNSAHTYMMINTGALSGLQWRDTTAIRELGPGSERELPVLGAMIRTGSVVSGDISPDGIAWTIRRGNARRGKQRVHRPGRDSPNNGTTTTATFDNVGFGASAPPDPRPGSVCLDNQDCCGALTSTPTAACQVDVPVTNPVTRHCLALASNSCVAVAGACTSDSDCCGFPTTSARAASAPSRRPRSLTPIPSSRAISPRAVHPRPNRFGVSSIGKP